MRTYIMELESIIFVPEEDDNYHIEILEKSNRSQSTFGEIYKERGRIKIDIYKNQNSDSWSFDLSYLIKFLEKNYNEIAD